MNILSAIWHLFVGEPRVANAVKALDRAMDNLDKANTYQVKKAMRRTERAQRAAIKAAKADAESKAALEEAGRCQKVRGNIAKLLDADAQ